MSVHRQYKSMKRDANKREDSSLSRRPCPQCHQLSVAAPRDTFSNARISFSRSLCCKEKYTSDRTILQEYSPRVFVFLSHVCEGCERVECRNRTLSRRACKWLSQQLSAGLILVASEKRRSAVTQSTYNDELGIIGKRISQRFICTKTIPKYAE